MFFISILEALYKMHIKLNKKNLNVKNVLTNDAHISRKFNFLEPSTVVRYFLYLSFVHYL